jgi:hypothetical protein
VYLLEATGKVRWFYNAADTVFSSPAFANVDRDKNLEMIIGTDISRNDHLRPPTKDGGFLYALKTNRPRGGSRRITFNSRGAYVWRTYFNQVMQSSPIVADVLPGVSGPEIVVGSGCFFPRSRALKNGSWIKVINPRNGRVLQTLNASGCSTSSPAVGDIDDDGLLEVVSTINGNPGSSDDNSKIMAWKATNPNPIWVTEPRSQGYNDTYGGTLQSAVVADIDGNGSLEVLAANGPGVVMLSGRDGAPLTCMQSNCGSGSLTLSTDEVLQSTPTVADLNGDGVVELIAGGSSNRTGMVYVWTAFNRTPVSPAGAQTPFSRPWPMFRGNSQRNGNR